MALSKPMASEALQDLRICPQCGTKSYIRKKICINMFCKSYFMRQAPNTNLWVRGPINAVSSPKHWDDMVDVFLNNELSSARSARLLHNAAMAGARHVQDLQVNQSGSNAQRDLLRKCFRNSKWPSVYEFSVPGWNQAKQCEQQHQLAMLLPHELLHAFLKLNSAETMLANQRNVSPERPDLLSHLAQLQQMLLTGIWSDGVPFNSDRSQTLETISLNIFGDDSASFSKGISAQEEDF